MSKNMTSATYYSILAALSDVARSSTLERLCVRDESFWLLPHMCEPYQFLLNKGLSPNDAKKKAALSIGKILSKVMKQHAEQWEAVMHGFVIVYKKIKQ